MQHFLVFGLLALVAAAGTQADDQDFYKFSQFVQKYGKYYHTKEEFAYRFEAFKVNLGKIAALNEKQVLAGGEPVFGIGPFADIPAHEFAQRLMKNLTLPASHEPETPFVLPNGDVDWRNQSAITPVKDQGQCGSCWAFSATEATESFAFLSKKFSLLQLSPQQVTACTYNYNGCNGGWPYDGYNNAIIARKGLDLESDYPYDIPDAGKCKFGPTGVADKPAANIVSYKSPAKGQLANVLASTGPPSICVAAESWQTYTGGILKVCTGSVDHCVQAVGYSTSGSESYWIVRNSWGAAWGEQGYIYLDMTAQNGDLCQLQDYITYPTE
jgi:cathepsin F